MNQQYYEYIVCIDFEATCWENQAPPKWRESEIIGKISENVLCFFAVILDVAVIDVFPCVVFCKFAYF